MHCRFKILIEPEQIFEGIYLVGWGIVVIMRLVFVIDRLMVGLMMGLMFNVHIMGLRLMVRLVGLIVGLVLRLIFMFLARVRNLCNIAFVSINMI